MPDKGTIESIIHLIEWLAASITDARIVAVIGWLLAAYFYLDSRRAWLRLFATLERQITTQTTETKAVDRAVEQLVTDLRLRSNRGGQ